MSERATQQVPPSQAQSGLPTRFVPRDHEAGVRARWDASGAFHADPDRVLSGEKPPYCIFIPPPNVTARLHLGHALNNSLQDILARAHRMKGFEVLWMPGTDHAGIATQTVVEQRIQREEGKRRADFTREAFIARVQAWKDEYEKAITDQLKAIGCSCDWERQRFTMDEVCARAVREAFFRLFRDGLIYRGKRLVNWDPVTQTALSDDEVEMEEVDGFFYYLRYPLVRTDRPTSSSGTGVPPASSASTPITWSELARLGYPGAEAHSGDQPAWITVATTRPETYLGDTAVAINPHDPRASALKGLSAQLPLVGRVIPIIEDSYVVLPDPKSDDPKAKYATGFLKVTPAHDPNDYEIGRRHDLPIINVMAPDASISDKHGWTDLGDAHLFVGLPREAAREKVVAEFKARGLLEAVKPYIHSVGHSYRSHAAIEPYLSDQWYCKVTDDRLRGWAQRALVREQRTAESLGMAASASTTQSSGTGVPPVSTPPTSSSSPRPGIPKALTKTRRNLPHWQLGGSTYFVTFTARSGGLLSDQERQTVLDACLHWHGDRARIHLVTVMPDHVHMILSPTELAPGEWRPLSDILHSIKSFSAHAIQKSRGDSGPIWQDESFDRVIRDADEFEEKWNYMLMNPVRAGLVSTPWEYPFTKEGEEGGHRRDACATRSGREAGEAESGDHSLRFFPARYARTYESWHDNLRDWCISRQLWWGHQIPVWRKRVELTEKNWHVHLAGKDEIDSILEDSSFGSCVVITRVDSGAVVDWRQDLNPVVRATEGEYDIFVCTLHDHHMADLERNGYQRDPDVLDTWFSSALWPLSTLGWPEPPASMRGLLDAFNPSAVLCTAREIITLWVSRMVMFNRCFTSPGDDQPGRLPFKDVYIHPLIQDGHGQRMSKSLGNGVDPLDIVHSHGSDALRFVLAQTATATQDVRMPVDLVCPHCEQAFEPQWTKSPAGYTVAAPEQKCPHCSKPSVSAYGVSSGSTKATKDAPQARNSSSKFDLGRNFCTKLWNASRFAMMKLESASSAPSSDIGGTGGPPVSCSSLPLPDRWILSRLASSITKLESALGEYQFSVYAQTMYDLLWRDFCDWYLEAIKPTVESNAAQRAVLRATLDSILRLLHPVCPFITEVIHEPLRRIPAGAVPGLTLRESDLLCTSGWPETEPSLSDPEAERAFERIQTLVSAVREARSAKSVEPRRRVTLHADADTMSLIARGAGVVETLAGLASCTESAPDGPSAVLLFEGRELAISGLADAVDPAVERAQLADTLAKLEKDIGVIEKRLANPGYVDKAPAKLVEETRASLAQKQAERDTVQRRLKELG